jgi:hypothetical protein
VAEAPPFRQKFSIKKQKKMDQRGGLTGIYQRESANHILLGCISQAQ